MISNIRRFSNTTDFLVVTLTCYWWAIASNVVAITAHLMHVSIPVGCGRL